MDFLLNLHQFEDLGLLILRVAIGTIFLVHGASKWSMWKQPQGTPPNMMTNIMRLLSIVEPVAGIAVFLGVFTQVAAIGLALVMIGAIYMKSMKWQKSFTGDGGWELDFMILAGCITLLFLGAGGYSFDNLWGL